MHARAKRFLLVSLLAACGGDDDSGGDTDGGVGPGGGDAGTDATDGETGSGDDGPGATDDGQTEDPGSDGPPDTTDDPGSTGEEDGDGGVDCGPSGGAGGPTGENEMTFGSYPKAWMYAPPNTTEALPLLVSLHGSGDDAYNFNYQFLGAAESDGFLMVTPSPTNAMGWSPAEDEEIVFAAIEAMKERHNVDTCRIHVAGFSAGAYYSFMLGLEHADFFASFGSIQGSIVYAEQAGIWPDRVPRKIAATIHHGTYDGAYADAERSRDLLEAAGHTVHFKALPGVGHEVSQQIASAVWQDMRGHRLDE